MHAGILRNVHMEPVCGIPAPGNGAFAPACFITNLRNDADKLYGCITARGKALFMHEKHVTKIRNVLFVLCRRITTAGNRVLKDLNRQKILT